jgi:hypothetical protein
MAAGKPKPMAPLVGGELGGEPAVGIEAVQAGGIVAGAVADDGVGGHGLGQVGEDLGEVELAGDTDRLGEARASGDDGFLRP